MNFQSWRCGSAPTNYHWRAPYFADLGASTPGGAISVGRAGSGKTGWLSPAEAKVTKVSIFTDNLLVPRNDDLVQSLFSLDRSRPMECV